MQCIIRSRKKTIPLNIWKRILFLQNQNNKINENKFDLFTLDNLVDNYSIIQNEKTDDSTIGGGFFLLENDIPYVVTCDHVIGLKPFDITCFINTQKEEKKTIEYAKLKVYKRIKEFDLVILKFVDETIKNKISFYTLNDFESEIDKNNLVLSILKLPSFSNPFTTSEKICIRNVSIENTHLIHHILPKIPMLIFDYNATNLSIDNLKGFSGSLITQNDKPVGILTAYSNGKTQATPLFLLTTIIKNKINEIETRKISKLYGFNIPTVSVEVEYDGKLLFGKLICEESNVSYEMANKNKQFKFKENDVIIEINNKKINCEGNIDYCSNKSSEMSDCENVLFNINTDFFMLLSTNENNNICNFKILREEKKNITEICVNLKGKYFNELYNINIFNGHKYLYWKGLIFTELSEQLINEITHLDNQYTISNEIIKQPKKSNGNRKNVVLIDFDYRNITDKNLQKISDVFLFENNDNSIKPFFKYCSEIDKMNKQVKMPVLEKFGSKIVQNLDGLINAIENNTNNKTVNLFFSGDDIKNKLIYSLN